MKHTPNKVAATIKADLKKKNITQKQLAGDAGVSQQWVTRLLSGEAYIPETWATWFEENYGYNPAYLMTGEGPFLKNAPSFEMLCDLVKQYRIQSTAKQRLENRWNSVKDNEFYKTEEKQEILNRLLHLKTETNILQRNIDMFISLDENELYYKVWQLENSSSAKTRTRN